jgi:DNA-binding transcriptional LysR family regulator
MRNFEKLDETSLRAFYFAAETLSFTKAAKAAALTQSGISQHVAKLEENLNVSLFLRAGRKVQLTKSGSKLKKFVETYLDQVDDLLEDVRKETQLLKGQVRYAMPNSCLMTPHFPLLLKKRQQFADVDLKITICHTPEVIDLLLAGEIDFGFVTSKVAHNDVEFMEFAKEEYLLVSASKEILKMKSLADLKNQNFINYPGMDELFEKWQQQQFSRSKKLKMSDLKICGEINDLNAAITMAGHGVGLGVFPGHCISDSLAAGKLYSFKSVKNQNPIYIVKIKDQRMTSRVQKVLNSFWEMK